MKINYILTGIFLFIFSLTYAQNTPQSFKYQGVARDANDIVVGGIGLQFSIHEAEPTGTVVYQERHFPTTNDFGVFSVNIGTGTATEGDFNLINWGAGEYFLQIELDPNGGASYTDMGTSQFLSVPYALYADKAGSVINDQVNDADANPNNELQDLQLNGSVLSLSNSSSNVDISSAIGGGTLADMAYVSGGGSAPSPGWGFIVTPVTVTITSSTQKVFIVSNKSMGSNLTGGASGLDLSIGYKLSSASGVSVIGGGSYGQRVQQYTRVVMGLSAEITGLTPGVYSFGLLGKATTGNATNWNSNEYGYTTVLLFN